MFFCCIIALILGLSFLILNKKSPVIGQQKLIIEQQSMRIESLYYQLHNLYNGLFELEQLLDNVIEQVNDELDHQYSLEQKSRIIKNTTLQSLQ